MTRWAIIVAVGLIVGLVLGVFIAADDVASSVVASLMFGWLRYMLRVFPRVTIGWDGVALAVVCLLLFGVGFHGFMRWLVQQTRAAEVSDGSPRPRWAASWTTAIVGLVLVMFVAGIAAAGIVHQVGWLIASDQSWLQPDVAERRAKGDEPAGRRAQVAGSEAASSKRVEHNWQTLILPYMWIRAEFIDFRLPWNHRKNAPFFKLLIPSYLNPSIAAIHDVDGFGLSHVAGNVHALGPRAPKDVSRFPRGASQTIMAGEIAAQFPPWGQPGQFRDPAAGLNRSEAGFGRPTQDGALFLFVDGSVRFVRNDADENVLRSLADGAPAQPLTQAARRSSAR